VSKEIIHLTSNTIYDIMHIKHIAYRADFNTDRSVDFIDFAVIGSRWRRTTFTCLPISTQMVEWIFAILQSLQTIGFDEQDGCSTGGNQTYGWQVSTCLLLRLVRYPAQISGNRVCNEVVCLVDVESAFLPTSTMPRFDT